eukprot:TRINITY_DN819_c0_g1_i2.p1 TRINITY_DN819_c0_g1~~TRINITY_DN819_c0_g1_i2.p1  ORF type:complete len:274 (+),score=40.51 TRINITY_DN819_c0_g1_i2:71-892(+)
MMSRNSVPTIPLDDVQLASTAELAALDESDEQLVTTLIASNYQDTARRWLKQSNAFQRETYVEALNLVQSAEVYREMPTKGRRPLGNTFKERFCYASTYMVSFEERDARVAPPVIERSYAHQQTGRLARPKTVSSTYRDEYLTKSKPDYFRACPADIFKLAGKYLSQAARDRAPTLNKLHQLDLVRALQSLERFAAADPLRAQTARISRDFYNTTVTCAVIHCRSYVHQCLLCILPCVWIRLYPFTSQFGCFFTLFWLTDTRNLFSVSHSSSF